MGIRQTNRALAKTPMSVDTTSFWALWEEHHDHLHRVCRQVLGDQSDDTEDALSETMLKAWEGLTQSAQAPNSPVAWLTRVAYHVCIDRWRDRRRTIPQTEESFERGASVTSWTVAEDPEQVVMRRERLTRVLNVVEQLPSPLRDSFVLHVFDEMPYSEIAQHLSISEANARKRVQKARELLREMVEHPRLPGAVPLASPAQAGTARGVAQAKPVADAQSPQNSQGEATDAAEVGWQVLDTRVVHVASPSGTLLERHLDLDYRPAQREVRVRTLRRYVARYPRGWKKRLELANLLYAAGSWDEAITEYCRVLASQRRQLGVWVRLGKALRAMGSPTEARVVFEAAVPFARRPATRHYLRGLAGMCAARPGAAAITELQQAAALEPGNAAFWHALGDAHSELGHPCDALQAYNEALRINPSDTVALTRSQEALAMCGRPREAQQRLASVVELEPGRVPALSALAERRSAAGMVQGRDGQRTQRLIRRALDLAPDSADVCETAAQFAIRRGEWDQGLAQLRAYTDRHPLVARGWRHYARWLLATGHCEDAAAAARRAMALDPEDFEAYRCALVALPLAGHKDEVPGLVRQTMARFGSRWDACIAAATAMLDWMGDAEAACQTSRLAVERQPHLAAAWVLHGEILARAGRHEDALEALEHGWSLLPDERGSEPAVRGAFSLATCWRALGDEPRARQWFEDAALCARRWASVDLATAHYWLARALDGLGDGRAAASSLTLALRHHLLYPARQEALAAVGSR